MRNSENEHNRMEWNLSENEHNSTQLPIQFCIVLDDEKEQYLETQYILDITGIALQQFLEHTTGTILII